MKLLLLSLFTQIAVVCAGAELSAPAAARPASPFAVADEKAFFSLLDLDRKELAAVKEAVAAHDWAAAKQAWAHHLETRSQPRWVWSRRDRAELLRLDAEKFGGHVLSRFGYWRNLGYAYWGTSNRDYAEDFVFLLKSWVTDNPVPFQPSNNRGTNGSVWRTLEAGIRGDAWFDAMELFMDAPEFDAEAKFIMTKSLVEHARYLQAWSKTYRAGNWQVCEASGLATIGIMLPKFKESADFIRAQFAAPPRLR